MDKFLNWKIPLFNQTVKEFFTKKTNYIGLVMMIFGLWVIAKGATDLGTMIVMNGLGFLGYRDALTKS